MQLTIPSKLSSFVSLLVNPLFVPTILFVWIGKSLGLSSVEVWRIAGVSLIVYFLIPVLFLLWLVGGGHIKTLEARDHSKRKAPLLWGSLWFFVGIPLMAFSWPHASALPFILSVIFAGNGVVLALVTLRFKISLHVSSICGLLSIVVASQITGLIPEIWLFGPYVVLCILLIALVSWARLHQKAHSGKEVWGGLVYGLFVPALEIAGYTMWIG